MSKVSPKVTNAVGEIVTASYRWLRVNPDTQADFAGTLGQTRASFTLPAIPYNDSRVRVNFKVAITDPGATVNVNRIFSNGSNFINNVDYYSTAGGQKISQLDESALYSRCVGAMLMDNEQYMRLDSNLGSNPAASVADKGRNLCPNRIAPVVPGTPGDLSTALMVANTAATQYNPDGIRVDSSGAAGENTDEINEPRNFSSGADTTLTNVSFSMPLSSLAPCSPASIDKTTFCPVDRTLELMFNATDKVGFIGTSVTVLATGATTLVGYNVSDLHLMVPTEANDLLRESQQDQVRKNGQRFLVPRLRHVKVPTAATAFSTNYKVTSGDGHSLLAVFWALQDQTDTGIANYNISNLAVDTKAIGAKLVSSQARLDSKTLSDSRLVAADMDDYNEIKDQLDGCAISSAKVWNYNRCMIDSWTDSKTKDWLFDFANFRDGKDLREKDLNYSIEGTTPSASQFLHLWIVTQGTMEITSNGSINMF